MKSPPRWTQPLQELHSAWQQRPQRERRLLLAGGTLLAALALWQIVIAPAWSVWRKAPAHQAELDARTREMLGLQAEVRQWQTAPPLTRNAALLQLRNSAEQLLGPGAQLQAQGDQLQLTLRAASAEGLAQWLAQARSQAQTRTVRAELQRQDAHAAGTLPTWQGQLSLRLP